MVDSERELDIWIEVHIFGRDVGLAAEHDWQRGDTGAVSTVNVDTDERSGLFIWCRRCNQMEYAGWWGKLDIDGAVARGAKQQCYVAPRAFLTDPAADYLVLAHVREHWHANQLYIFSNALAYDWFARLPVVTNLADAMLQYQPGDYARAAKAVLTFTRAAR